VTSQHRSLINQLTLLQAFYAILVNSVRLDMLEHTTEEIVSLPVYRAQPEDQECDRPVGVSSTTPNYIMTPPPAYAPAKPATNNATVNQ
jgi:hypothetical protein